MPYVDGQFDQMVLVIYWKRTSCTESWLLIFATCVARVLKNVMISDRILGWLLPTFNKLHATHAIFPTKNDYQKCFEIIFWVI